MLFESIASCSALDVTWARFRSVLDTREMFNKLTHGRGLDHADVAKLKKRSRFA